MTSSRQISIFVLIDALGWEFLKGRQFLNDLLPYRVPLRTVLGFSSGAIPTILTGLPPSQTGHWNLFFYDPAGSPFRWFRRFFFLPEGLLNHRITRKLMKELGRRFLGLGKNFECCVSPKLLSWFNYAEPRDIYAPGGLRCGRSIFDQLAESGRPYGVYTYHQGPDQALLQRLTDDLSNESFSFFFLYLSQLDHLLHDHWHDEQLLTQKLRWYEGKLRAIFDQALALDPDSRLSVCSDHGMTPVAHHFDLARVVEGYGFSMPEDYLAVYDSTMLRLWFFSEQARDKIVGALDGLECGSVLSAEETAKLGIWFADARYGQVIFLMKPGWLIAESDFNGHSWVPAGMHGYHPDDPFSDAVFLGNHTPQPPPRSIADLHGCLTEALSR